METLKKKVVFVGDGACGLTYVILQFIQGRVPDTYVPTVFENLTGSSAEFKGGGEIGSAGLKMCAIPPVQAYGALTEPPKSRGPSKFYCADFFII